MNLVELTRIPNIADLVEAEMCRRDFEYFVKKAWPHCDPAELIWGWHMSAICKHLQAVADGKVKNLLINVPPGHAKSMLVSILFPAWMWTRNPAWQSIQSSYGTRLSNDHNNRSRNLLYSEWYQRLFMQGWKLSEDQNNKSKFANTKGGARMAVSIGASATGLRGNTLIIDDPLAAGDANSKLELEKVIEWYTGTMTTRFNDKKKGSTIIIMQRLHEADLVGYLMTNFPDQWCKLILPTEFEPARRCKTKTDDGEFLWQDPRSKDGELLFPAKFDANVIAELKQNMGSYSYAAQHQQRPVPATGGMIKYEFFKNRWDVLPEKFESCHIFVDCSFKNTDDSDRVAIGVFGKAGPQLYLMDLSWGRMGFVQTINSIKELKARWPQARGIHIEDKANGSAVIEVLKGQLPGVIPIQPDGGKESRISAITAYLEAGNLVLPAQAPWVNEYIAEAVAFPKAPNDDALDMTAYAMNRMLTKTKLLKFLALAKG